MAVQLGNILDRNEFYKLINDIIKVFILKDNLGN